MHFEVELGRSEVERFSLFDHNSCRWEENHKILMMKMTAARLVWQTTAETRSNLLEIAKKVENLLIVHVSTSALFGFGNDKLSSNFNELKTEKLVSPA